MAITRVAALSALLVCCAGPLSAQTIRLEFHDGKVNLITQNADVRTILTEWARLGDTHVVNAERLAGPPLTLQLTDVSETQALNVILRGTAGYIAGARTSVPPTSRSALDRIMVVPTAGTATIVPSRAAAPTSPAYQQIPQAYVEPAPNDDDGPRNGGERVNGAVPPGTSAPAAVRTVAPSGVAEPAPYGLEENAQPTPAPTPRPANPFGVTTGSARPGMPAQQQPQRPPAPYRQEP
jgi:hypothetical protein